MRLLAQPHCPQSFAIHIFPRSKWHMLHAPAHVFANESNWYCFRLLLRTLCAVEGAALHALGNASSIESAADDVVTHARQIAHLAAADQNNRVLLQVVADAGDVASTFDLVRQTNTGDFTQCGIRLLRGLRLDGQADAALLRTGLQNRGIRLAGYLLSTLADQLIDRRHGRKAPPEL